MKVNNAILIIISLVSLLFVGCSNVNNNEVENIKSESLKYRQEKDKDNLNSKDIENHIPYIDEYSAEIDNSIIDERYKNVKKEELSYNPIEKITKNDNSEQITKIYYADSIKQDTFYKDVLQGFTYFSEINSINLTYDEAIELVKKVLPDDIEKVNFILDKEFNKEYIYYNSSQGNFRVGLCYGEEFDNENLEEIHTKSVVGIDYSKEIK